jgi:undecaprenyl-diphosphatase
VDPVHSARDGAHSLVLSRGVDGMELTAAIVLGIIQGLTEFLPVSSSAHLILVPWLFGWEPEGLTFDIALHLGTAIAVLGYFWRDWMLLAKETVVGIIEGKPFGNVQRKLGWFLVLGTIPAMAVGLKFEKLVESNLRSPLIPAFTLVFFGVFLWVGERLGKRDRTLENFTVADSLWIGLSQAIALIPGVSRSGITIGTAMWRHVDRSSAARFSFLLSTPVIAGAALLQTVHLIQAVLDPLRAPSAAIKWDVLTAGVISAAVTGFLCIRYFLRYIQTRSFTPFVVYRFLLAGIILIGYFSHGR